MKVIHFTLVEEKAPDITSQIMINDVTIAPEVWRAVLGVALELTAAIAAWPDPMHSAHEGHGVIAEEWKELKDHIYTNQKRRDLPAMRKEATQLSAMAARFVVDVCDGGRGRV